MAVTLVSIARELYCLEPSEFTAARNARVQELRDSDPELSKQVAALRKASPAASVVNALAVTCRNELEKLVELGEAMREAQRELDRAALVRLSRQRRDDVKSLMRSGISLATGRGQKISAVVRNEIEQTLQAATVEVDAAAAVTSGRLVRSLAPSGFEPVDLADAVAAPDPGSRAAETSAPRPPVDIAVARRRAEARREVQRLDREAQSARATLEEVDRRSARLDGRRTALNEKIAELETRLDEAETDLTALEVEARELAAEREHARSIAEATAQRADQARDALD